MIYGKGQRPEEEKRLGKPLYLIISYQARNKYTTYVHELGHNRSLHHTFETGTPISKYFTFNFMDYSANRNLFFKQQFEYLFNNTIEK